MYTLLEKIAKALALILSVLSFSFSFICMLVLLYFTGVGGVMTLIYGDPVVGVLVLLSFAALCLLCDAMAERTFGVSLITKRLDRGMSERVSADIARAHDELRKQRQ